MKKIITPLCLSLTAHVFSQSAGSLDPTFGTGGKVVTSISTGEDKAYGVAIQADGKIVVAGFATSTITGKDVACVRYNTDGSLDATFGTNGIVTTDLQLGSDDIAYSLALQADGKIVLAGSSDNGSNKDAALIRYLPDGSIDSTFGTNGIALTDFDNLHQDEAHIVKIHALTGNIIIGGSSTISSSLSKPVVARYLNDGTIDSTFNNTGIRLLWITANDTQYLMSVEDLAVQSNGKISAAGWRDFPGLQWDSDYWAGRINSDGTMDATFSTDGVNTYNGSFNGHDRNYAMLLRSNNNILMAGGGYISTLRYDFTAVELSATGSIGTWGNSVDFGSNLDDIAYDVLEDVNGQVVLAGSSGTASAKTFAIARLTTGAVLDIAFAGTGKVTTTFGANTLNECFEAVIQPDNKIVAIGYTGNDFALARYLGSDQAQLDAFNLILPANAATGQNYSTTTFDWSNAFGATAYEMDIDVASDFSVSPQTYSVTTSTHALNNLQPNTQYFWRVRASDGTNWGPDSDTWSFTTNTLENFTLLTPVNNAVNQQFATLVFDWSNAVGAASYELEIDSSIAFTENPQTVSAATSTYTMNGLQPVTDYYWHVRASNGSVWGQWSQTWKLTTKAVSSAAVGELAGSEAKIYPNPAGDLLFLETTDAFNGQYYTITDNAGKTVLPSAVIEQSVTAISLEELETGIYYLKIGENVSLKIVKL